MLNEPWGRIEGSVIAIIEPRKVSLDERWRLGAPPLTEHTF